MSNSEKISEDIELKKDYVSCFVGYVDILGFKALVKSHHSESIHYWLERLMDNVKILCPNSIVKWMLVSDSLLLFTNNETKASFEHLTGAVAAIIPMALSNGLLCRGAISHGDFYFNDESTIFFGPAYLDAVEYEKKQEWMGVILTPICRDFTAPHKYIDTTLLIEYEVPMKKEVISRKVGNCKMSWAYNKLMHDKMYCINWIANYAIDKTSDRKRLKDEFYQLSNKRPDVQVVHLYENTLKFYDHCIVL